MGKWLKKVIHRYTGNVPLRPAQKIALGGLVFLLAISFVQSTVSRLVQNNYEVMLSAVLPSVVVALTNEERVSDSLNTLTHSKVLDESAKRKAEDMRDNQYFAHDSPHGVEPWYWFDTVDYDYVHAGENLAIYFDDSEEVVNAWMHSPLHKDNILKKEYTEIGVAAVKGKYKGYDTVFVVQHFGTPAVSDSVQKIAHVVPVPKENISEKKPVPKSSTQPDNTTIISSVQGVESIPKKTGDDFEVARIEYQNDTKAYVTNHVSTSTNKEPEIIPPTASIKTNTDIPSQRLSPKTSHILNMIFLSTSLLVIGLLLLSLFNAQRKKQYVQFVYGIGLLTLLLIIISLHTNIVEARMFIL